MVADSRPSPKVFASGSPCGPRCSGQASIEAVAAIPVFLLAVAAAAQLALVGFAAWSVAGGARAAARAAYVGAEPLPAARQALPDLLAGSARVREAGAGAVEVEVRVPELLPWLPDLRLGAESALGPAEGGVAG
jgi:hypothetical protein